MRAHGRRGLSLVEVMIAVSLLAIGILAVFGLNSATINQTAQTRQRSIARLAAISAREALETQPFRKQSSTDVTYFLYGRGGATTSTYPIAWNPDGTAFQMPDCTQTFATSYTAVGTAAPTPAGAPNPCKATVDSIPGCVVLEFPVPPLKAPPGRTHPGRIVFYLSEPGQTAGGALPSAAFPFQPTPGKTYLDCDGCGLATSTTTDLRACDLTTANPFKLIPVRISVDWVPTAGAAQAGSAVAKPETYVTHFLLSYRGW